MSKINWKQLGLVSGLGLSLVAAGCSSEDSANGSSESTASESAGSTNVGNGQEIELAYVEWEDAVVANEVLGIVLEDIGYDVTLTPLDNAFMWESVANGEADAHKEGWLPYTHAAQYEEYGDDLELLGPNLEDAKLGFVVPTYMDVDSIADLTDEAGMVITGIEPGSGAVAAANRALEDYNLDGWEVQTSSSGAMAVALGQAIENEEPIIITGWNPHWMFQAYDLKYLEDPEGTFGEAETINTFVREGFEEDMPEAYQVLDQFYWTLDELESIMIKVYEGADPAAAAQEWVDANPERVAEWTEGVTE